MAFQRIGGGSATPDEAAALRRWAAHDLARAVASVEAGIYTKHEARREFFVLAAARGEMAGVDRGLVRRVLLAMLDEALPLPATATPAFDFWSVAGEHFGRLIDDRLRPQYPRGVLPWERPVRVGEIDYWRVAAHALDWLGTVLQTFLPGGAKEPRSIYVASHPHTGTRIEVSLMSGRWWDAGAGRRGHDLVSLVAHVTGLPMPRAAAKLARQVGVEACRHV